MPYIFSVRHYGYACGITARTLIFHAADDYNPDRSMRIQNPVDKRNVQFQPFTVHSVYGLSFQLDNYPCRSRYIIDYYIQKAKKDNLKRGCKKSPERKKTCITWKVYIIKQSILMIFEKISKFSIFIILQLLFATPSPNRSEYKPKKSNHSTDFERRIFAFAALKYSVIRKGLPPFLPCVIKKFVLSKFCDLKRIEF